MTYDPLHKKWLLLDWNLYLFIPKILSDEEADMVFSMMYRGATFVRFKRTLPASGTTRSPVLYCVSMVKHILGVKSWAITPFQLYCALLFAGGQEIVPKPLADKDDKDG